MKPATGRPVRALALALALLAAPGAARAWQAPPDPAALPDDVWGRTVRQGRDLITDTAQLIGPLAADPARRFAASTLTCANCHLAAGTKEDGLPLVGAFADFPQYRPREGRVGTLEDRINGCMQRSMNGRALPANGAEMRAMVAYLKFLATGVPVGTVLPGRGPGALPLLDRAADPARGAAVYARACTACHGGDGDGRGGAMAAPPLWGPDSFNDGAGMARLTDAARFIRNNMPFGASSHAPMLSVDEAWDVAAFVISRPRPVMAGKAHDYPILRQKPVDAAFPPYADGFSTLQHRFGPFQPILAARQTAAGSASK